MRAIHVDGLVKDFGAVRAVDDLSFSVEPGSVTGFLGPNGAGKTTTLRCLLGLVAPSRGEARIGDVHYADLREPARTVGAALESSSFHPGRTARNHLAVMCAAAGIPDRRAEEVLDLTGMAGDADRRVGGYSTGMRQRLSLAASLLGDPDCLVLDEPASGLDPAGISWLRRLLQYLAHDRGKTVLVSSHMLAEMEHTADHVVIIARGRLVTQGSLEEIVRAAGGGVRVRSPYPDKLRSALCEAGLSNAVTDGALLVPGASPEQVGHIAFVHDVELSELAEQATDLEEVFLQLTGPADHPPEPARWTSAGSGQRP